MHTDSRTAVGICASSFIPLVSLKWMHGICIRKKWPRTVLFQGIYCMGSDQNCISEALPRRAESHITSCTKEKGCRETHQGGRVWCENHWPKLTDVRNANRCQDEACRKKMKCLCTVFQVALWPEWFESLHTPWTIPLKGKPMYQRKTFFDNIPITRGVVWRPSCNIWINVL